MAGVAEALQPFFWQGNQAVTKAELDRRKKIADALRPAQGYQPTGPWSTVGALADEGVADFRDAKTSEAESAAQQAVADALAKGDYQSVLSNDLATPQQSAVAQALWQQKQQEDDPLRKLQIEQAQLNLEQDKAFGDQPKERTLTSIYDANGREQKGYMEGDTFVPVGSPKASIERPEYNATQATAAGYADRMAEADHILSDPKLAAVQTDLGQAAKAGIPVVGNMLTSPEFQQADQAQRNFINAILRRESGAVISDSEFTSARKQYFPQPGDSAAVLAQKASNRANAINGVARAAGPAYQLPTFPDLLTDPNAGNGGASPAQEPPVQIKNDSDYDALPPGTTYQAPDGTIRTKR